MLALPGLPKVTVPGPLTLLHASVSAPGGLGRPSSPAAPARLAPAGGVIVESIPALTEGAWFTGPLSSSMSASTRKASVVASLWAKNATRSAFFGASPFASEASGATPAQSPVCPSVSTLAAQATPAAAAVRSAASAMA
ncbi:MAG: hypothetical protein IPQ15_16400 [Betaproteobacteria bacterium]|nr:hypothetical protein [Betaproteobacteria bacterium]